MSKHDLGWFKERVGKKVYRTKSQCNCMVCYNVFMNGLYISDDLHANYLFDCQNELDLYYFDEPLIETEVEQTESCNKNN